MWYNPNIARIEELERALKDAESENQKLRRQLAQLTEEVELLQTVGDTRELLRKLRELEEL